MRYAFRMHHYGPYSEDLDTDLTRLKLTGYVAIDPDPEGYGFHVTPLDQPERSWPKLAGRHERQTEEMLKLLGDKPAYELELAATIHFVSHILEGSVSDRLAAVRRLKPGFDPEQIMSLYVELHDAGLMA